MSKHIILWKGVIYEVRYKLDNMGRVSLPAQFRKAIGIVPGDELEVSLIDSKLIIEKVTKHCSNCNETENLTILTENITLCQKCYSTLVLQK